MIVGGRAYDLDDVERIAAAGLAFAELDLAWPITVRRWVPALLALRDKHDLFYLAHGPNETDPADLQGIEKIFVPQVMGLLPIAAELGIQVFTQHFWLEPRCLPPKVIERKIELLTALVGRARECGMTLCIENLSEHASHLRPAFECIPDLGLTLDIGHGQILAVPNAAFGLIEAFPGRIHHVHAHDNHGGKSVADDLHLPVGEGNVDFPAILSALRVAGYDGTFALEVPLSALRQSRKRLERMWAEVKTEGG